MAKNKDADLTRHANEFRRKLRLPSSNSPNAHSEAARDRMLDLASGCDYFSTLLELIPQPPHKGDANDIRRFLVAASAQYV
jgi:hypothetical protein